MSYYRGRASQEEQKEAKGVVSLIDVPAPPIKVAEKRSSGSDGGNPNKKTSKIDGIIVAIKEA
jgi:hypothetical protein